MENDTIQVGLKPIEVWPKDQTIETRGDQTICSTTFLDVQEYHPRLIAKILELEEHRRLRKRSFHGACGTKIHHLEKWLSSEAELITMRARAFFRRVLESDVAVVDLSWANVYRAGDFCMPHSHVRSTASVIYCLETGDDDTEDALSGQFGFIDPRLSSCCPEQEGCMTAPFYPGMKMGTMLIFPSQLVHTVNPYLGRRPRITLSWNINKNILPGSALAPSAGNE